MGWYSTCSGLSPNIIIRGNAYNILRRVLKTTASIQWADYDRLIKREEKSCWVLLRAGNFHHRQELYSWDITYLTRACFQEQRSNYKENFLGVRGKGSAICSSSFWDIHTVSHFSKQQSHEQCAFKTEWLRLEHALQSFCAWHNKECTVMIAKGIVLQAHSREVFPTS